MRVLILSLALAQASTELQREVAAGLAARKTGDIEAAIRSFERVAQLAPNLAAAHMNLGAAYFDRRSYAKAIPALRRALELNMQLPGAHALIGRALLEENNAAEAVRHLEAAAGMSPADADVMYFLAKAHAMLSQQLAARLIDAAPDSPRADQAKAEALLASARVADAEAAYRTAIAKAPALAGLHLALGELFVASGNPQKAYEEFEAELKVDPYSAQALYRLGALLTDRGDLAGALDRLRRADSIRPDMPQTLLELGRAEALSGRLAEADAYLRRVIEIEGKSPLAKTAHYQRSQILRRLGKIAEADEELRRYRAK